MTELNNIFNRINEVFESEQSDYSKVTAIHKLEGFAKRETWTNDQEYALSAKELADYANFKWAEIYSNSDKEVQEQIEDYINDQVLNGIDLWLK